MKTITDINWVIAPVKVTTTRTKGRTKTTIKIWKTTKEFRDIPQGEIENRIEETAAEEEENNADEYYLPF